jgi:hypothetical protein
MSALVSKLLLPFLILRVLLAVLNKQQITQEMDNAYEKDEPIKNISKKND